MLLSVEDSHLTEQQWTEGTAKEPHPCCLEFTGNNLCIFWIWSLGFRLNKSDLVLNSVNFPEVRSDTGSQGIRHRRL